MLTEEDFEAIDAAENTNTNWETLKNVSRNIADWQLDNAKMLFKGVSRAGMNFVEGLESAGAEIGSYLATGKRLTSAESKDLPLHSLRKDAEEALGQIKYKTPVGQATAPFGETVAQFATAGAPGRAAKIGETLNFMLATGLGFSGEDENAAALLKLIPNKYAQRFAEIFENDPNSPEWDNRLMNVCADLMMLPVFNAAEKGATTAGGAAVKAGAKAVSKVGGTVIPDAAKALYDKMLVATRMAWRNHKTKKFVDGVKTKIEEHKQVAEKVKQGFEQAKQVSTEAKEKYLKDITELNNKKSALMDKIEDLVGLDDNLRKRGFSVEDAQRQAVRKKMADAKKELQQLNKIELVDPELAAEASRETAEKVATTNAKAKVAKTSDGKPLNLPPLEEPLPPGKNMAEESERILKNIENKLGIKREDIKLSDMEKFKKSGVYENLSDESYVYQQILENQDRGMPGLLKDVRAQFEAGKITDADKAKLQYDIIANMQNKAEKAWHEGGRESGTYLGVKGHSEEAKATQEFRDWFNKNAADVSKEHLDEMAQIIEQRGPEGFGYLLNNALMAKGPVKDTYDFGRLIDNIHLMNQALRLTSIHQLAGDFVQTGSNVLYHTAETMVATGISKAQKLKFKNADTLAKRAFNNLSTWVFGSGEATDPMAFAEGLYYLKGTVKGYVGNILDNKLARQQLKKIGKKTNVMRIFENLPDDISSLNPIRQKANFQRIQSEGGIAAATNKAFDKMEKFGTTVMNVREYGDTINMSSALNGILEQRLPGLVGKNFPKEQQAKALAEVTDRAIDMLPLVNAKRVAFDNMLDSQIFSVAQDAYKESLELTLRDPLSQWSKTLYNSFLKNKWGARAVKLFEPFSKTRLTFWIDRVVLERTPLAKFTEKYKTAVAMGGREAAMAKAKMWLGSCILGKYAWDFFFENKIDGGYTKNNLDGELQADYSKVPGERTQEKSENFVPYSEKVGDYRMKLETLGIYGALAAKGLRLMQTMNYFMDRLDAKENVKYDEDGNKVDPQTQYGTILTAVMLAIGDYMTQGTHLEDWMDLTGAVIDANVDYIKRKALNLIPIPALTGEIATAVSGISGGNIAEYRQIMQAADTFENYLMSTIGLPTEPERDWRGRPIKSYSPLMFISGVKAKEEYEPDDLDYEIRDEQSMVSEPTNNTTIQPSPKMPSKKIVLSDHEVREWKKIMNEYKFVLPNGKTVKGVEEALRDLINSEEYKLAPEIRGVRQKIEEGQVILKSESVSKRERFRDRYNYIKKMALFVLYQENGEIQKKYRDALASPEVIVPTLEVKK